jgi:hypothetical protein
VIDLVRSSPMMGAVWKPGVRRARPRAHAVPRLLHPRHRPGSDPHPRRLELAAGQSASHPELLRRCPLADDAAVRFAHAVAAAPLVPASLVPPAISALSVLALVREPFARGGGIIRALAAPEVGRLPRGRVRPTERGAPSRNLPNQSSGCRTGSLACQPENWASRWCSLAVAAAWDAMRGSPTLRNDGLVGLPAARGAKYQGILSCRMGGQIDASQYKVMTRIGK